LRKVRILDRAEASHTNAIRLHAEGLMRVFYDHGICLQDGIREIVMDPQRQSNGSVVTHAHMDHLSKGALMTPETLAVMKVRLGSSRGKPLQIGNKEKYGGFDVRFHNAGHTFGSIMVEANGVLYTGDFNPDGGLTCGQAKPVDCETLVIESTYGKPQFRFPPKREVEMDILSWAEAELSKNPIALGAIEFGKAQELIALFNTIGAEVAVSDRIAALADVYNAHGHNLRYRRTGDLSPQERKEPRVYIVPRGWLGQEAPDDFSFFKANGGSRALVSGWCAVFNFGRSQELTAQFPLSDHADFNGLIEFAEACKPETVYTVGGNANELATEIHSRLGMKAESLMRHRGRKGGVKG